MKTLNEQIERLKELVRKCYGAVAGKNGTVPEVGERNMENLPSAIGSIMSASEVPKVKVYSFRVTKECINDEGRWEGENLIDTSECVTLENAFRSNTAIKMLNASGWDVSNIPVILKIFNGCSSLQQLDVSNWDISNVTSTYDVFYGCSSLQQLDISKWNVSNVTNMSSMFRGCSSLQQLDISKWNVSSATTATLMFADCGQLQTLDISKWNVSNLTSVISMFSNCKSLQSIIGNRTIDDVLANNISALNGLKISISLTNINLDRASLRAIINGLADLTGQTAQTLTLGATLIAKLTDEDIAIATNKNWTIA